MISSDLEINDVLRAAIIARLQFRKDFITALDLDCPLDLLSNYWPPILQNITAISSTHQLGKIVPGSFSTKIQRRLASTVPPRPIVELEFKDALETLKQLRTDCEEATRFADLPLDPLEYESFLWAFASRSPAPLPYSRAYLATILFHPDILNSSISLPLTDVKTLVFPSSPILDPINWTLSPPRNPMMPKPPRVQFALLIDEFVDRCGQPYLDFWIALGQNRCRLRRMLTHVIIAWDMLQADAVLVDADLITACKEFGMADDVLPNPFSTWTYTKKLWMIAKVVLLGFEQDIYLPDEYAGMYYFLSLIATKRKALLEMCLAHAQTRTSQLANSNSNRTQDVADAEATLSYITSELKHTTGIVEFSSALHSFYTILLYLHLLPQPKRPTAMTQQQEALRYELRMKPFLALQPPEVPPFPSFQAAVLPYGSYASPDSTFYNDLRNPDSTTWQKIDLHLKAAKESFAALKKSGAVSAKAGGVEKAWGEEVKGLLASCVALGVAVVGVKSAVGSIERGEEKDIGIKVDIPVVGAGKRYAEGWVVGKVVKQ